MQFNIPTLITIFRIVLIPFFVLVFYIPYSWSNFICMIIFLFASFSDWFDGYLARRWNQITQFGAFLDPVADKAIIATAIVLVEEYYHIWWVTLPSLIMIIREITIFSLREWMAKLKKSDSMKVSWIGKIKTTIQMISLICMLYHLNLWIEYIGISLFFTSSILTLWSMFRYLNIACNNFPK